MERKLAAIFSTDVQGYSRLMGDNEEATIRTLTAYREVMTRLIQQHRGRVVDSPGDNLLAEFASAVDAELAAVEIQHELQARNTDLPPSRQMHYRIGLNVGDVVVEGERLYGDGVNIAARIESFAEGGGISISGTVYDQVKNKLALSYVYQGEQSVKNIVDPVRVWRVVMDDAAAALAAAQAAVRQAQHEQNPNEGGTGLQSTATDSPDRQKRWINIARLPRTVALAGIGLLLLVGVVVGVQHLSVRLPASSTNIPPEQTKTLPLPDKPSIAVLPFTNMSGDPEQDYFSDGITDTLITDLSKISGLFIIARNSVFVYKGQTVKLAQVSRELGVRYVLESSVQRAGDRIRINTQLVDAMTGGHLWAERYDRDWKDIFALQDEITRKIVTALEVKLTKGEQESVYRRHTDSLEAYNYLLRGLAYYWRYTPEANAKARQMWERAIELDSTYADAYALLGYTYWIKVIMQWSPEPQALERAFTLAQKALALDDSVASPHMLLGSVYNLRKQYELAVAEGERAVALEPNSAQAYHVSAEVLNVAGRSEEALKRIKGAMRLDPHYPPIFMFTLGWTYSMLSRYEEAIAALKQAATLNPDFFLSHLFLAVSYSELARYAEAQAVAAELRRITPNFSVASAEKTYFSFFNDQTLVRRWTATLRKAGLE